MLEWSCARLGSDPWISDLVVVLPPDAAAAPPGWLKRYSAVLVPGGPTRRASVRAGLAAARSVEYVLIHDAARPFVPRALVRRLVGAVENGPVVPGVPLVDAVKVVDGDRIVRSLDRGTLRGAQTPQAFPRALIADLHETAASAGLEPADDAELCEREGIEVRTVEGDPLNFKVTTAEDFERAERLVEADRVRWPGGS